MKIRFLIFISFFVFIIFAQAQKAKVPNKPKYDLQLYHFGFSLGINNMDFMIKNTNFHAYNATHREKILSIEPMSQKGFNVGIVSNLRLGKYFDLRFVPDLAFGDRKLIYKLQAAQDSFKLVTRTKKIESTFINLPLLLKYKSARIHNFRVYVITGLKYSFDLASLAKKKVSEDEDNIVLKLYSRDLYYDIGVGVDYYLPYFKFATEIKMSYGTKNILKNDHTIYTDPIERLNSKVFLLSFLFE